MQKLVSYPEIGYNSFVRKTKYYGLEWRLSSGDYKVY